MDAKASVKRNTRLLSHTNLVGASLLDLAVFFSRDGQLLEAAEINLDGPDCGIIGQQQPILQLSQDYLSNL